MSVPNDFSGMEPTTAVSVTSDDPLVGQLLGDRYRVTRRIARGGMATIYAARHSLINRQVAIKVLRPEYAVDLDCVERFVNEGRAAGTLGHPNIVESLDMGVTPDGTPYLVLELLDGESLDSAIRATGPLPIQRAAQIGRQIAAALATAHGNGVVHRDLKSDNVFLIERLGVTDHVKVFDFGISKFVGMTRKFDTQKGTVIGTPDFMPPEQIRDPQSVDARSDVYSLGMILYHMLAGRLPFEHIPFPLVLSRILSEEPRPIAELRPDLPAELATLITWMLAKEPAERPQSMGEIERALSVHATRVVLPMAMPLPATRLQAPPAEPTLLPPPRAPRGSFDRTLVAGLITIALAGLGATGFALARRGPSHETAREVASVAAPKTPAVEPATRPAPSETPRVENALAREVTLHIVATVPGAQATIRGRVIPLPYHAELARGSTPEVIRVTAPGRQGRLYWVTLDEARYLAVDLKPGRGVLEATPEETAVALGEVAPSGAALSSQASHSSRPPARPGLVFAGFAPPATASMPAPASVVIHAPLAVPAAPAPPVPPAASLKTEPPPVVPPPLAPSAALAVLAPTAPPRPALTLPYSSFITSHRVAGDEPRVPLVLRSSFAGGSALAHVCVADDGHVAEVRMLRATAGLEDAVRESVRGWRYRPFLSQGHAVPVCFDVPFEFKRGL